MSDSVHLTPHRITVLLVDDQQMVGESVRRMLITERDIDFHYCQDPLRAIKTASEILPTVILQDLVMPEMDGLRLVRYFRANASTRDVPLIVLSSKEDAKVKADAFALGANDYMVKLPDRLELVARIRYHSKGYINFLERNEAYNRLLESQRQLTMYIEFIRKTFGRYLSEDVVKSILDSPEGMRLGGEKRRVTILMSDLRGFTPISERLPAEHVVDIINIYLEEMTEVIMHYKGTIDEFIGDAILVVFGAPVVREDDARRAVACALSMQLAMSQVNERNRKQGYPDISQGIGVNTGDLVVGNIGSTRRSKYGVVGQNVNLAARIESYTVGGQILISESTREACGEILRIHDQFTVIPKGFRDPITIFDVGGIAGGLNVFLPDKPDMNLPELKQPIPVRLMLLEGKHVSGEGFDASIVRFRGDMAEIRSDTSVEWMTNVRLMIVNDTGEELADEVYAKVTRILSESPPLFRVRLTSIPPSALAFFERLNIEGVLTGISE